MADTHGQQVIAPDGSIIEPPVVAHPENWEHTYSDHRHDGNTPAVPAPVPHPHHPHVPSPPPSPLGNFVHNAEQAAVHGVQAAWNFVAGDDINTLRNPHASAIAKTIAGVSLAATVIPGVGEEKLVAKGVLKVGEEVVEQTGTRGFRRLLEHPTTQGVYQHVREGVQNYAERLRDPHQRGRAIGEVLVGGVLVNEAQNVGQRALQSTAHWAVEQFGPPSYQTGGLKPERVHIRDGETFTGHVTNLSAAAAELTLANGYKISFDSDMLLRHDGSHGDLNDQLQQAAADGREVTLRYQNGQFEVSERPRTWYWNGTSRPEVHNGFSSTGRVVYDGNSLLQQLPSGETREFDVVMLREHSANWGQMERQLKNASGTATEITLSLNGGYFFASARSNARAPQHPHQI